MKYSKKDVLIGIFSGFLANFFGILLYMLFFSKYSFETTLADAYQKHYLGSLIGLGGVLNLILFFIFIKRNEDARARGVLIATIILAVVVLFLQF